MTTVTLSVSSTEQAKQRLAAAFRGEAQGSYISFASIETLWRVLTAKRWQILQAMTAQGPLSIREVARRVDRDVKSVHSDIAALVAAGVVEQTTQGVRFPYDAIHVDFTLSKAA